MLAAEKLGVAVTRCVVIEDSVNGVRAGVAAGMQVWGFVGGPHCLRDQDERLRAAGATRLLRHMRDVSAALRVRGGARDDSFWAFIEQTFRGREASGPKGAGEWFGGPTLRAEARRLVRRSSKALTGHGK